MGPTSASAQRPASLKKFSGAMPGTGGFNPNITQAPKKAAPKKSGRRPRVNKHINLISRNTSKKGGWGWGGGGKR